MRARFKDDEGSFFALRMRGRRRVGEFLLQVGKLSLKCWQKVRFKVDEGSLKCW